MLYLVGVAATCHPRVLSCHFLSFCVSTRYFAWWVSSSPNYPNYSLIAHIQIPRIKERKCSYRNICNFEGFGLVIEWTPLPAVPFKNLNIFWLVSTCIVFCHKVHYCFAWSLFCRARAKPGYHAANDEAQPKAQLVLLIGTAALERPRHKHPLSKFALREILPGTAAATNIGFVVCSWLPRHEMWDILGYVEVVTMIQISLLIVFDSETMWSYPDFLGTVEWLIQFAHQVEPDEGKLTIRVDSEGMLSRATSWDTRLQALSAVLAVTAPNMQTSLPCCRGPQ